MKIVLVGIQGSGKGTQGKILQNNFNFDIFETGGKIREIASLDTQLGKIVKETIEAGNLVSIDLIGEIIKEYLNSGNSKKVIFDGIPRNMDQKDLFDSLVKDFIVLYLRLDKEEAKRRLLNRKFNPKTGETFPPHLDFDPKTNDELIHRSDDNEEAIRKRIEIFFSETQKVIDEYKKQNKVIEIDASKKIDEVTLEITNKLGLN